MSPSGVLLCGSFNGFSCNEFLILGDNTYVNVYVKMNMN